MMATRPRPKTRSGRLIERCATMAKAGPMIGAQGTSQRAELE
jgi:hypothetical protein